jgi:hypothetical protein
VVTFIAEQTYSVQELVYVQGMISGAYLNDEVFEVLSDIPSASYAVTMTLPSECVSLSGPGFEEK